MTSAATNESGSSSATVRDLAERAARSDAVAAGILRTAVDPIIVIDPTGMIVNANDATAALFGYERHELIGSNVSKLMPSPDRERHDGYVARYLEHGEPRIIGIGREVRAQRADGTTFPVALAVSEVRTETDHFFTGILHDLTERNRQRDRLRAANEQLETRVAERTRQLQELLGELRRSNRDLEQFAYVASHDLQTPLRNVRQGLRLLDEHLRDVVADGLDDEAGELRALVIGAVDRMEELIKGLLVYSRLQHSAPSDREAVDLGHVVDEVVASLRPELTRVGGTVSVEPLPTVTGNPVQLRQVFQNLIENAIRFRSRDRPLQVRIRGLSDDQAVTVEVADNGSGVDAGLHQQIFELFRRGDSGNGGTGLGLAICQRVVEGHNGTIWVESQPDKGAVFAVQLPAFEAADATRARPSVEV